MPYLAAIGTAIASAASAVGPAVAAAIGPITVGGLAQAAAVISMGTGILSNITGSKTLGKISMGFGIASGVGSLYSMGTSTALSAGRAAAVGGEGLMQANTIEGILSTPTKGTKAAQAQGFKTFDAAGGRGGSMEEFANRSKSGSLDYARPGGYATGNGGSNLGSVNEFANRPGVGLDNARPGAYAIDGGTSSAVPGGYDPKLGGKAGGLDLELEKSFFERTNDTLTKYNSLINVAAGVGQGYMQSQQMEQQERLFDKRLAQDQQLIDRTNINNGTVSSFDPTLNLSRKANPFPLLQRN